MNWTHFSEPSSAFALAALPGGRCLAATGRGLWLFDSQAAGGWSQVAPQFAEIALASVAAHGATWMVGSDSDIAVSRDAGATWAVAELPVRAHVLSIALSPAFERDAVALAATARDGVFRSDDAGATWHAWNFGLLDLGVNALAVSPDFERDATCFAATDFGVFASENGGRAWRELALDMTLGPFVALAMPTAGELLAGTEGAGLWSSASPYGEWRRAKGARADEINALAPGWAATSAGLFSSSGGTWAKALERGDLMCLAVLDDGALLAGATDAGVWRGRAKLRGA